MEHAGARDAYTHAYVYIYSLYLLLSLPLMKEASDGLERLERMKGRHACLASDEAESGHEDGGAKGTGVHLPHRPAMCFRASRVSRGGSSIQIEEG